MSTSDSSLTRAISASVSSCLKAAGLAYAESESALARASNGRMRLRLAIAEVQLARSGPVCHAVVSRTALSSWKAKGSGVGDVAGGWLERPRRQRGAQ